MGNNLLIASLVFGLLFGGFATNKLHKLNPFKAKAGITQKDEGRKEEYFKDKIKGIEYRSKESHKLKNKQSMDDSKSTIGQRLGSFVDSSLNLVIGFIIFGIGLFFLTGINIFKKFKQLISEANKYRKALKQTVKGIKSSKEKLNGNYEILANALRDTHDDDTEAIVKKMKNE